jgi:hypothetical protein
VYTLGQFRGQFCLAAANPIKQNEQGALMRFPIRPGKATCAGVVAIFMVLPNSIWKGPDANVAPVRKAKIESVKKAADSDGRRVKPRKVAH